MTKQKKFNRKLQQQTQLCRRKNKQIKLFEISKLEEKKENRMKKSEESPHELWDTIKQMNIPILGVQEGEQREKGNKII